MSKNNVFDNAFSFIQPYNREAKNIIVLLTAVFLIVYALNISVFFRSHKLLSIQILF